MSGLVVATNAHQSPASGRLTPGVARSFRSDGSDGDRNTTPGVAPFSPSRDPDPVPANTTPGVAPFRFAQTWPFALLLVPMLAFAQPSPAPTGLADARRVERYAGDVALAAQALGATAATVSSAGRLHSLQRLQDRLADLDRSILDLERAVVELEGAVEPAE